MLSKGQAESQLMPLGRQGHKNQEFNQGPLQLLVNPALVRLCPKQPVIRKTLELSIVVEACNASPLRAGTRSSDLQSEP